MTAVTPELPGGPCTLWTTGEEILAASGTETAPPTAEDLDPYAIMASELLYEVSGRQFRGECEAIARPCRLGCGCWGDQWGILNTAWFWGYGSLGYGYGWGWFNSNGNACGCGCEARVKLAGFPVTAITEIQIDGVVLDASAYELQEDRYVQRLWDDSTTPPTELFWPTCQNLALPLGDPGTWGITYSFGSPPPTLGAQAATELGWQLYLAQHNPGECLLPVGVTRVTRQGITIDRLVPMFDPRGERTGLIVTDSFLAAYNPNGLRRRPAVYTPDVKYPRRVT
jgi:hypothetical protein